MQEQKIKVIIDKQGNVKYEVQGVVGSGCQIITDSLDKALSGNNGGLVLTEYKPEFYQTEEQQQQNYNTDIISQGESY